MIFDYIVSPSFENDGFIVLRANRARISDSIIVASGKDDSMGIRENRSGFADNETGIG